MLEFWGEASGVEGADASNNADDDARDPYELKKRRRPLVENIQKDKPK